MVDTIDNLTKEKQVLDAFGSNVLKEKDDLAIGYKVVNGYRVPVYPVPKIGVRGESPGEPIIIGYYVENNGYRLPIYAADQREAQTGIRQNPDKNRIIGIVNTDPKIFIYGDEMNPAALAAYGAQKGVEIRGLDETVLSSADDGKDIKTEVSIKEEISKIKIDPALGITHDELIEFARLGFDLSLLQEGKKYNVNELPNSPGVVEAAKMFMTAQTRFDWFGNPRSLPPWYTPYDNLTDERIAKSAITGLRVGLYDPTFINGIKDWLTFKSDGRWNSATDEERLAYKYLRTVYERGDASGAGKVQVGALMVAGVFTGGTWERGLAWAGAKLGLGELALRNAPGLIQWSPRLGRLSLSFAKALGANSEIFGHAALELADHAAITAGTAARQTLGQALGATGSALARGWARALPMVLPYAAAQSAVNQGDLSHEYDINGDKFQTQANFNWGGFAMGTIGRASFMALIPGGLRAAPTLSGVARASATHINRATGAINGFEAKVTTAALTRWNNSAIRTEIGYGIARLGQRWDSIAAGHEKVFDSIVERGLQLNDRLWTRLGFGRGPIGPQAELALAGGGTLGRAGNALARDVEGSAERKPGLFDGLTQMARRTRPNPGPRPGPRPGGGGGSRTNVPIPHSAGSRRGVQESIDIGDGVSLDIPAPHRTWLHRWERWKPSNVLKRWFRIGNATPDRWIPNDISKNIYTRRIVDAVDDSAHVDDIIRPINAVQQQLDEITRRLRANELTPEQAANEARRTIQAFAAAQGNQLDRFSDHLGKIIAGIESYTQTPVTVRSVQFPFGRSGGGWGFRPLIRTETRVQIVGPNLYNAHPDHLQGHIGLTLRQVDGSITWLTDLRRSVDGLRNGQFLDSYLGAVGDVPDRSRKDELARYATNLAHYISEDFKKIYDIGREARMRLDDRHITEGVTESLDVLRPTSFLNLANYASFLRSFFGARQHPIQYARARERMIEMGYYNPFTRFSGGTVPTKDSRNVERLAFQIELFAKRNRTQNGGKLTMGEDYYSGLTGRANGIYNLMEEWEALKAFELLKWRTGPNAPDTLPVDLVTTKRGLDELLTEARTAGDLHRAHFLEHLKAVVEEPMESSQIGSQRDQLQRYSTRTQWPRFMRRFPWTAEISTPFREAHFRDNIVYAGKWVLAQVTGSELKPVKEAEFGQADSTTPNIQFWRAAKEDATFSKKAINLLWTNIGERVLLRIPFNLVRMPFMPAWKVAQLSFKIARPVLRETVVASVALGSVAALIGHDRDPLKTGINTSLRVVDKALAPTRWTLSVTTAPINKVFEVNGLYGSGSLLNWTGEKLGIDNTGLRGRFFYGGGLEPSHLSITEGGLLPLTEWNSRLFNMGHGSKASSNQFPPVQIDGTSPPDGESSNQFPPIKIDGKGSPKKDEPQDYDPEPIKINKLQKPSLLDKFNPLGLFDRFKKEAGDTLMAWFGGAPEDTNLQRIRENMYTVTTASTATHDARGPHIKAPKPTEMAG